MHGDILQPRSGFAGAVEARLGLSRDDGAWPQIPSLELGAVRQPRRALQTAQALEFKVW
mgnify:CR=1 FL=1